MEIEYKVTQNVWEKRVVYSCHDLFILKSVVVLLVFNLIDRNVCVHVYLLVCCIEIITTKMKRVGSFDRKA